MYKSGKNVSAAKMASIGLFSVMLGLVIFFISKTLASAAGGTDIIFAVLSTLAAILSGMVALLLTVLKSNYKILKAVREKAVTDDLTELYNRSFLDSFLEHELEAADKSKNQVSVIMADLDHFKEINDNYGHVVGDHVLTIFAHSVLKCLRKTDIIARYGGDEFLIVLPATDTDTAQTVADRIRQEVSETYIPPIDGVMISSINCSIGISTYPVHCDNKNSLIRTSDLALYMAKHSGRNCTKVYEKEAVLS